MGKLKRAKKFQKNHLSAELKHRKEVKKHNQLKGRGPGRAFAAGAAAPRSAKDIKFDIKQQPDMADISGSDSDAAKSATDSEGSDMDALTLAQESQDYLAGIEDLSDTEQPDGFALMDKKPEEQVTRALISKWAEQLKSSSKPIKHILRALATEEDLTDLAVLDSLLKLALNELPDAISRTFSLNNNNVPIQTKKLAEYSGSLKYYAHWLAQTLARGRSQRTDEILQAIHLCMPYFLSFRKVLKDLASKLSAVVVNIETEDVVKMNAFSVMRDCCIKYPSSLLEIFLKTNYELLMKMFGNTNAFTHPSISLAKNLFAALYTIEPSTGYQTSFKQVRQLALSLKMALDKQKHPKVATEVVYTWPFVHSLDFFSRIISLGAENVKSPLLELIHPLVQITLRTSTLLPGSTYFPLRFHLLRSLVRLSRHTGVYIPLFPILLEVLDSSAVNKRGKKSSLKQFDFANTIHVSQSYADTAVYQKNLSDEIVDLLAEIVQLHAKSIAFPELTGPLAVQLKRYISHGTNAHLNRQLQTLLDRVKLHRDWISRQRESQNINPRDIHKVQAFLAEEDPLKTPFGEFVVLRRRIVGERLKAIQADRASRKDGDSISGDEQDDSTDESN